MSPENGAKIQQFAFEWFVNGWGTAIDEIIAMVNDEGKSYEEAVNELKQDLEWSARLSDLADEHSIVKEEGN